MLVGLGIAAVLGVVLALVFALHARTRRAEADELRAKFEETEARNRALSVYQGVLDAVAKANEIAADAKRTAASVVEDATKQATAHVANAQAEAAALRSQAESDLIRARGAAEADRAQARAEADELRAKAREAKARAEEILAQAGAETERILDDAKARAVQIAGDAYSALEKSRQLEETARAMKNVIEGYGDQYLVPTFSLLDQLAEEFGFDEAGKKLKEARDRVRMMIKAGTAATCEYAEATRRETAIDFVLDAFNGKVDSVLADVRHDNFGTLEQKIKDAFSLVNHNGKAFRDASITPAYLDARLDELRWASTVQELKLKDREEQRALREKIREEEKAQREFERAMKEAQKEEEVLKKAMEKAQAEIAKASDEQRAKYEQKLQELAARLREAEEKNQRALSMAQQTRSGFVYVISNIGSFGEDVFKIGLTRRLEPLDRIRELGDASVPFDFDVHAMIKSDDAPALERELHKKFLRVQMNKVNPRKEFFRVTLHDIRAQVEKLGLPVAWTMTALAKDFRETQVIEKQMKSEKFDLEHWEEQQIKEHEVAVQQTVRTEEAA